MGDRFTGKPSLTIVTNHLGKLSLSAKSSTSFGWGKGGNVTSAGWQVTLCHRGPKRKLRASKRKLQAGYRALSRHRRAMCHHSYFCYWASFTVTHGIFFIAECCIARFLCAMRALCVYSSFGHPPPPPLGYFHAKFRFCRALQCWASPWRKLAYSITQSLTQLIWFAGNRSFRFGTIAISSHSKETANIKIVTHINICWIRETFFQGKSHSGKQLSGQRFIRGKRP